MIWRWTDDDVVVVPKKNLALFANMEYQVGDRVERIEDREITGATVLSIQTVGDETILELQYDEGGTGWWPATSIRPLSS